MNSDAYHVLAKDAGNRLKGYVIGYSSAATGVFFISLADSNSSFTVWQKAYLIIAIVFFVATTVLCLVELHVDARRFFYVATQLNLPVEEQSWKKNEWYKALRVRLMYVSYLTLALATLSSVLFLIARVA